MTIPARRPEVEVTDAEARRYLQVRRLPRTALNLTAARAAVEYQKQSERMPKGRNVTATKGDAARRVVYGQCRVDGFRSFFGISADKQFIHTVETFAGHEIEDIWQFYLDDWRVDFGESGWCVAFVRSDGQVQWNSNVYLAKNLGTEDQYALASLTGADVGWTVNHRQRGCAHAHVAYSWNSNLFGDDLGKASAIIRGKKVYDPRVAATVWRRNAALIVADYLTDVRYGLGRWVSWSDIDEDHLVDQANICDELIQLKGGGQETRYTIDGWFDCNESYKTVLTNMASAFAGSITLSGGKWRIWPAAWRTPVLSLELNDFIGGIEIETIAEARELFNRVKGTHANQDDRYETVDYPPVVNATYLAEDDATEKWEDIDRPFTTSPAACQRLGKIDLERIRQGIRVKGIIRPRGLVAQPPENATLDLSRYGFSSNNFEFEEMEFLEVKEGDAAPYFALGVTLRETAEGVFTWADGEETQYDVSPNTTLPNPFSVTAPTTITLESGTTHLYARADGTIMSRLYIAWNAVADYFVRDGGRIEVQYRRSYTETWYSATAVDPTHTHTYIVDVEDGAFYDARVRFINAMGVASEWNGAYYHQVIGKTEPPADVEDFEALVTDYGIELAWDDITDIDRKEYELRKGSTWAPATFIARTAATKFTYPVTTAGAHSFLIKALDTSGNPSTNATPLSVTINAPSIPSAGYAFDQSDAVLSWSAAAGTFAILEYVIRAGATFETASEVARTKGSSYRLRASWGGSRRFWVSGVDFAKNEGAAYPIDAVVVRPGRVEGLTVEVIRNQALFRWSAPLFGSLPVDRYRLYRGETFAAATYLGDTNGTFFPWLEFTAGDNVYWWVAVDTAGNLGIELSVPARISAPQDFALRANVSLDPADADTLDNVVVEDLFTPPVPTAGIFDLMQFLRGGV